MDNSSLAKRTVEHCHVNIPCDNKHYPGGRNHGQHPRGSPQNNQNIKQNVPLDVRVPENKVMQSCPRLPGRSTSCHRSPKQDLSEDQWDQDGNLAVRYSNSFWNRNSILMRTCSGKLQNFSSQRWGSFGPRCKSPCETKEQNSQQTWPYHNKPKANPGSLGPKFLESKNS